MSPAPPEDVAVSVEGLSKAFRLPHEQIHTLKERAVHPLRRRRFDRLQALDDVSLTVRKGEFFGIVGRNGSGKSTLMKCLAGIYSVDAGEIWLRGRMAPFIELGVGFNPDLTAHDNVLLNAVMLGLTPEEADGRYEAIIDFAELHEFQDLKLKNYSSGMQVRLAFAVMVHVEADLLLIDEVLAVGDAAFQQKCYDVLHQAKRDGRTILFVTHDMGQIRRFCDRAVLLERGRVVHAGPADDVARRYTEVNFARNDLRLEVARDGPTERDGRASILSAWAQSLEGPSEAVEHGASINLCVRVRFEQVTEAPVFEISVADEDDRLVFVARTDWLGTETGVFDAGEQVDVVIAQDNWLAAGRYAISARVLHPGPGGRVLTHSDRIATFVSTGSPSVGAAMDPPYSFHLFADRGVGRLRT